MFREGARGPAGERGYALVAAVAAVAAFAFIAFQVLASERGVILGLSARVEQARLEAAADGGVMLAVHALADSDLGRRWSIDGQTRAVDFDGVAMAVTVEDERGKAPLDGLNQTQSRALFQGAGASGERLDALVDELRDFQGGGGDEGGANSTPPPGSSEATGPSAAIRQGGFRTVGDLMALKDMSPALYNRVAPAVTVFFEESGPFEAANAGALAKVAMAAEEVAPPGPIDPQGADEEAPSVEPVVEDTNLVGRTLTVRVVARGRGGALAHRTAIVELTGAPDAPYWVRYVE